jgi:non-specific serine/threonine protein kinase/serine/threonine-protein kinase
MPGRRWDRLKDVFAAALREPADRRDAFVDEACSGDASLRREVVELLAAHRLAGGPEPTAPAAKAAPGDTLPRGEGFWVGRRVGAYRIEAEIGRGGMGAVFQAVRDDDVFLKKVALKLVRGGVESDLTLDRLRQERQILAQLDHPFIARLLDGGATEEGLPFFVMEYVDGVPIDVYCRTQALGVSARLDLFRRVCSAVQYAHQNLVVHRDIKPGNILVAADGSPKLLDFGIAKLLVPRPGMSSGPTVTAFPMMTPEYASPEQLRNEAITTATDVYSLGVLLYELLTGRRPYRLATKSFPEILRAVCEQEPERPSTAVLRDDRKLHRRLAGDLDTIVLHALSKEPGRRYASVEQLSEDVRRHLAGLPVVARGDTLSYRARKFARRNRAAVVAGGLVVLSLLAGIVATSHQARIARAERARAEGRFADVRRLANSFLFDVHDAIAPLPGSTPAREMMVARAAEYLDSLSREARDDVELQRELAVAFQRLGDAQGGAAGANLGDTKGALRSYEKALAIRRGLVARAESEPRDVEMLAQLEFQLGSQHIALGDLALAEEVLASAVGRIEGLEARARGDGDYRGRLAAAYQRLGFVQARRGRPAAALVSLRRAVEKSQEYAAAHPGDPVARANLAYIKNELGERLLAAGEAQSALETTREARAIQEALIALSPNDARIKGHLVATRINEGRALRLAGDAPAALRALRRAVGLAQELLAADPRNRWNQIAVFMAERSLGHDLLESGDRPAAVAVLQAAAARAERVVKEDPANAFSRNELAVIYADLAAARRGRDGASTKSSCAAAARGMALWDALAREGRLSGEYTAEPALLRKEAAGCLRPPSS